MKAVRIEEFGGPEVLRTADLRTPEPGEDEVLIELRASGINRVDVLNRGGGTTPLGNPRWCWDSREAESSERPVRRYRA